MSSPGSSAPPVRYHVADLAVARIAARRARAVPSVVGLRADLSQTLLGLAGTWLNPDPVPPDLRAEGVTVAVHGDRADVRVTVVTELGPNCRELALTVQGEVARAVREATGLDATVQVTIADIELP
ncbi:Asp23/Gls24 family envelope stress response protein [Pseudonocardia sp. KRD291]|uniref:Asp23/Gls24 family envelope stress response protein n=1 Tax=Pseudonocardia sp. KRD291 TaxID=2792007 RepID=UPI001C49E1B7|nr:Asp23/Gls24 family envelope stress response protein [Pseudonocardia sp. KRD291]MBW0104877.1 Asp23/Gls24 family envelope stress response protein [Pseudonocardia sp. KRD291]